MDKEDNKDNVVLRDDDAISKSKPKSKDYEEDNDDLSSLKYNNGNATDYKNLAE
jgi:hypothetical protein